MKVRALCIIVFAISIACSVDAKQNRAEQLVEKIEQFKAREKGLPDSIKEIGEPETEAGPIYYKRVSDSRYEVWYGTSLGESVTYDSDRKTWK